MLSVTLAGWNEESWSLGDPECDYMGSDHHAQHCQPAQEEQAISCENFCSPLSHLLCKCVTCLGQSSLHPWGARTIHSCKWGGCQRGWRTGPGRNAGSKEGRNSSCSWNTKKSSQALKTKSKLFPESHGGVTCKTILLGVRWYYFGQNSLMTSDFIFFRHL